MRTKLALLLVSFLLLAVLAGDVLAAGAVYYGPSGRNSKNCGPAGNPCRTYAKARKRACALSDKYGTGYYIYHLNTGSAQGFCDKSGGSGIEPGVPEPAVPYDLGSILWPTLSTFLAGLVLGFVSLRRRR